MLCRPAGYAKLNMLHTKAITHEDYPIKRALVLVTSLVIEHYHDQFEGT